MVGEADGIEPAEITIETGRRRVVVRWSDGHQSAYPWEYLRWRCPCAACRGEWGRPGALATTAALTTTQCELIDLHLVGRYAVQPRWADGHDTGIYAFEDLRAMCPCARCRRADDGP